MFSRSRIYTGIAVIATFAIGIILRIWNFGSTLHFELDQARDIFVVHDALTQGQWPLLGPMARGSDLFLGPVFYYFQIASGFLFGITPETMAYPDVVFGIGALVLTYIFVRRYFSAQTAVLVSALAATSLFLITYSTFAWNPNSMYFWSFVFLFGALMMAEGESSKKQFVGVLLVALSSGVLAQIHFIAFLTVPLILAAYMMIMRLRPSWKAVCAGIFILTVVSFPVIIHEVQTSGDNTRALIATLSDKGTQDEKHNILEKGFRAAQETATYFTTSMISDQHGRDVIRTRSTNGWEFICDTSCTSRLPILIGECILLFVALVLFVRARTSLPAALWRLSALWGVFSGVFFVLLAYQISPRFYLFVMPLFIVLWAIVIEALSRKVSRTWLHLIVGIVVAFNVWAVVADHRVSQIVLTEAIETPRDIIMQRDDRVTLAQLRIAADFVADRSSAVPYIIIGDNSYARALYYLTRVEHKNTAALCYVKRGGLTPEHYSGIPAFALMRTGSAVQIPEDLAQTHTVTDTAEIGTITVYELTPVARTQHTTTLPKKCFMR